MSQAVMEVLSGARPMVTTQAPTRTAKAERDARDLRWSQLMAAAQAGDSRAYETLLTECLPLVRTICIARLRHAEEAEDAVQDALLTLHRVRHTYDPARPFRSWLVAIADHRAIDRGRRRTRRAAREADVEAAAEVPDEAPGAEAEAARRQSARRLHDALAELPQGQRTALHLAKIEEMSLEDASARSGMSVGALKAATHRALRMLRRRLTGHV